MHPQHPHTLWGGCGATCPPPTPFEGVLCSPRQHVVRGGHRCLPRVGTMATHPPTAPQAACGCTTQAQRVCGMPVVCPLGHPRHPKPGATLTGAPTANTCLLPCPPGWLWRCGHCLKKPLLGLCTILKRQMYICPSRSGCCCTGTFKENSIS